MMQGQGELNRPAEYREQLRNTRRFHVPKVFCLQKLIAKTSVFDILSATSYTLF